MKQLHKNITILFIAAMIITVAAAQLPAEPNDIFEQSRALRRQFMIQKSSPVAVMTPQEEETSLSKLIEQVLSLTTPAMQDPNALLKASEPAADPNVGAADTPAAPKDNMKIAAVPDAAGQTGIANQLKTAIDGKQSVLYPMQLADVLYQADNISQAGQFYQMALNAANKDNASDYQWLLFQTANCLRYTDTTGAAALYEQLIQAFPTSVWAAAAQARLRMLNWMQINEQELQTRMAIRIPDEQ
jgi:tetratricopeptide (TPR) repeat protein